jgi:hypothetical protein
MVLCQEASARPADCGTGSLRLAGADGRASVANDCWERARVVERPSAALSGTSVTGATTPGTLGARATLHDLQDSLNDSLAGLQDIASALQACRRYDQVFAMNREWRAAAEKLDTLVKTYERDLRATRIVEILAEFLVRLDQAFDLVMELLARPDVPLPDPLHDARALAIEGFDAWLKSLPSEEWSPVDPAQVVDVHWVDSVGWVEGRKTA